MTNSEGEWSISGAIGPILLITCIFLLNFMSRQILAPLMPAIEPDLGLSHVQAGYLFLTITLGFFCGQIASCFVSARIDHKRTIVISAMVPGLVLLPTALIHGRGIMLVQMTLLGLFAGLYLPSGIAAVTSMVGSRHWGKALGIHQTAPSLSGFLVPFLAEALLNFMSWRGILSAVGGMTLIFSLVYARFGRSGISRSETPRWSSIRGLLHQPSFWVMLVLLSIAISAGLGIWNMLPLYLVNECGFDRAKANHLVGWSRLSTVFITFISGWLADLVGVRRFLGMVLAMTGLVTFFLGVGPRSWLVVVIFVQAGLAICFFAPFFSALSRIVPPETRGLAVSFINPPAFVFGAGVMPAFIGYMGEFHTFSLAFAILGGAMFLSPLLLLLLWFPEERDRPV